MKRENTNKDNKKENLKGVNFKMIELHGKYSDEIKPRVLIKDCVDIERGKEFLKIYEDENSFILSDKNINVNEYKTSKKTFTKEFYLFDTFAQCRL